MISHAIEDLSGNLMRPCDVLCGLVLLALLAALLGKDGHHIWRVYALHSHGGHHSGGQLGELVLSKELIKMLDVVELDLLSELVASEFLDKNRFVELVRLLHQLKSLLALNQEPVWADLEQNFHEIFSDCKWVRVFRPQIPHSWYVDEVFLELQEVANALGAQQKSCLGLCIFLFCSLFNVWLNNL